MRYYPHLHFYVANPCVDPDFPASHTAPEQHRIWTISSDTPVKFTEHEGSPGLTYLEALVYRAVSSSVPIGEWKPESEPPLV